MDVSCKKWLYFPKFHFFYKFQFSQKSSSHQEKIKLKNGARGDRSSQNLVSTVSNTRRGPFLWYVWLRELTMETSNFSNAHVNHG